MHLLIILLWKKLHIGIIKIFFVFKCYWIILDETQYDMNSTESIYILIIILGIIKIKVNYKNELIIRIRIKF